MTTPDQEPAASKIDPKRAKKLMDATVSFVKKLGAGAADLLGKLKKDKSPQAMLATMEQSIDANQKRREDVSGRVERLHNEIVEKKKAYATAAPARKRILEAELRSKLSEYKASERELSVLLENERVLSQVKGRLYEVVSYGMAGVTEAQIDDVIDEIEEAVAEAEGRADASRDLEKAGRRRERESDKDDFLSQLGEFGGDAEPSGLDKELAGFDEPEPAAEKPKRNKEEPDI
ncbi:MAG: hypothetical protein V1929_12370 [bacterium]